jgi:hypothetical protein
MITDTELKINGYKILSDTLGEVDAERFISILQRDKFDYTKWQKNLWPKKSIEEISKSAMKNIEK